jgi:DnaK suppressor protein
MLPSSPYEDRVHVETLRLLVAMAWADREVVQEEIDQILALGTQVGLSDADRDALVRDLSDAGRLPAPDLALLRAHAPEVLSAVDAILAADHRIVPDEVAARRAVRALLVERRPQSRTDEDPAMTTGDQIRERLVTRRRAVLARYLTERALAEEELGGAPEIEAIENATEQWDASVLARLADADAEALRRIDAALARLEAGRYGTCAVCRSHIDDARLAAIPEAVTCTECARASEPL